MRRTRKALYYRFLVWRKWVQQGRPRDRSVIVRRGTTGQMLTGWHLDSRYWTEGTPIGVDMDETGAVRSLGGYSIAELENITA